VRIQNKKVQKLLNHYKQIAILDKTNALVRWDLEVCLPEKGGEERAEQSAYLVELATERWLDKDFRKILEDIKVSGLNKEEKAIIRNLRYAAKFYHQVPKEIIVEEAKTTARAFLAWKKAKKEDKFKDFLPHLVKIIRLQRIIADHLGYKKNPYDALLDLYEPGLTADFCQKIFSQLQPPLTKVVRKIKKTKKYRQKQALIGGEVAYPQLDQERLALFVAKAIGYDLAAGRLDASPHPFTTHPGRHDVRITTRYRENDFLDSLTSTMHETGHALYEQGIDEEYTNTPLGGGVSLGIHESQSRFWENQIGRSWEFVKFLTPVVHAFYSQQLADVGLDELFALRNRVKPGLIRVDADEVTYNLHIILRFEIEDALINSKLDPKDLPDAWNKKMKKYLGVVPKTDSEGVLQDIHWSHGSFGYFPTYTLGNLYAAQFAAAMRKELTIEELIEKGDFSTILSWLRENIHQYGSLYWPDELVKKVTGEKLDPKYFLKYIGNKYKEIYNF
jgi:carboxypeptidase Taq